MWRIVLLSLSFAWTRFKQLLHKQKCWEKLCSSLKVKYTDISPTSCCIQQWFWVVFIVSLWSMFPRVLSRYSQSWVSNQLYKAAFIFVDRHQNNKLTIMYMLKCGYISVVSKSCWASLWVICISSSCLNIHKILEESGLLTVHKFCKYPSWNYKIVSHVIPLKVVFVNRRHHMVSWYLDRSQNLWSKG